MTIFFKKGVYSRIKKKQKTKSKFNLQYFNYFITPTMQPKGMTLNVFRKNNIKKNETNT